MTKEKKLPAVIVSGSELLEHRKNKIIAGRKTGPRLVSTGQFHLYGGTFDPVTVDWRFEDFLAADEQPYNRTEIIKENGQLKLESGWIKLPRWLIVKNLSSDRLVWLNEMFEIPPGACLPFKLREGQRLDHNLTADGEVRVMYVVSA